jgi:hypothetical protein
MLITGHPQFETQTDAGVGHGIPPIPEWQLDFTPCHDHLPDLGIIDNDVENVFLRLRNVFQRTHTTPLSSTQLHDLTCFVIHRLLLSSPDLSIADQSPPLTECVRDATILYMFIIQGPTYFSHAVIFNQILDRFAGNVEQLEQTHSEMHESLDVWFLAVGMVASVGTPRYRWFAEKARVKVGASSVVASGWDDVLVVLRRILWLETQQAEAMFRPHWEAVFSGAPAEPPDELSRKGTGFI